MTAALVYLAILVVAFFLLIVLPQRRRMSAHRALVDATEVGDEIVTTAGIHGTVRELDDTTLRVEIAPGVVIMLARGAVSQRRVQSATDVDLATADTTDTHEISESGAPPADRHAD